MYRRLGFALVGAASFAGAQAVLAADSFQPSAPYALLVDFDSGAVLYEKNADQPVAPPSFSKLLTIEIVFRELKEGRLHLDDVFDVSEHAWRTGGAPARGAAMFLELHSKVRVEDLLRGLIVQSGNDAAIVLAEGISGSEANFADLMNKRAGELGLGHVVFANSWGGANPAQRLSLQDLGYLAAHIVAAYPDYYHYFAEREFTWNKIRQLNRNPLLTMDVGADGLKTGDLADGGFGVVASAVEHGRRLIMVMDGFKTATERTDESRKMLDWGFHDFEPRTLFQAGDLVGVASVYGGAQGSVPLVTENAVTIFIPRGSQDKLTAKIVYKGPLAAPIAQGAEAAHLVVWRGSSEALDAPLKTGAAVAAGSLSQRALDAGLEMAGGLIRKTFAKN